MKWLFAGLLLVHGLSHLMGFAKAFGFAELPQLTVPISRPLGLLWLVASVLFMVTIACWVAWPPGFWVAGGAAVLLSQTVIVASWADAKFGSLPNAIVLVAVVLSFAAQGPLGFRAEFAREVGKRLVSESPGPVLNDADIASLPAPLRRYVVTSGALGQPRVRNFHATFRGRIRSGPEAPWMEFTGEQYNFFDPPARLFIMDARMAGLPVDVFHRFVAGEATMRVRVASLYPMVDARGPAMTRAETVTLFNDMCVFAPGTLADPSIEWREVGPREVEGAFTSAGIAVRATLFFNDSGELVDFISDDRGAVSADGSTFTPMRWSTPLGEYRRFGAFAVSARGVGRWHPLGSTPYDYIELSLTDLQVNVPARSGGSR